MGSLFGKPSQSDYDPGPAERASAATAKFDYERDKRLYGPIRKEYMKDVAKYNVGAITSRVASADTMQALTDRPNLRAVQNVTGAADNLSGMLAQSEQARTTALGTKREMQVGALEMARNKKAVDTLGLTSAAAHERSRGLSIAARKQTENMAIGSALTELGTSFAYAKAYGEYEGLFNKTGKDPLPTPPGTTSSGTGGGSMYGSGI